MSAQRKSRSLTRRVRLRATTGRRSDRRDGTAADPVLGWIWAALGGGALAAVAGWVLVTGMTVIGWLPGTEGAIGEVLLTGSRIWLLAHGAGVTVNGAVWTLPPLGVSAVIGVALFRLSRFAAGQALLARAQAATTAAVSWEDRARMTARVSAVAAVTYLLLVGLAAWLVPGTVWVRALVGAAILALPTVVAGAVRGSDLDVAGLLPDWARPVPRAVLAAQLVVVAGASGALATTAIGQRDRIAALADAVGGGVGGGFTLTVLQLAFLPTVLVWVGAFVLGGGFTVGAGTTITPATTQLGLLPAIPLSGALPPEGPADPLAVAWLGVGVLAGALAALLVMRCRPLARWDETALVGGLTGTLAGLGYLLIAAVSRGDLGSNRLTGLGPQLLELLLTGPVVMGLSGMLTGLVWGLLRPRFGSGPPRMRTP